VSSTDYQGSVSYLQNLLQSEIDDIGKSEVFFNIGMIHEDNNELTLAVNAYKMVFKVFFSLMNFFLCFKFLYSF
jgi:hypothetical protein